MSKLILKRYIEIAEDNKADESSRDDAICELAWTDNSHALDALYRVGSNKFEASLTLLASAGESIASIWKRRGWCSLECFNDLMKPTVDEILLHFRGGNEEILKNTTPEQATPRLLEGEIELTDFDLTGLAH